jgi:hypothetical protein
LQRLGRNLGFHVGRQQIAPVLLNLFHSFRHDPDPRWLRRSIGPTPMAADFDSKLQGGRLLELSAHMIPSLLLKPVRR